MLRRQLPRDQRAPPRPRTHKVEREPEFPLGTTVLHVRGLNTAAFLVVFTLLGLHFRKCNTHLTFFIKPRGHRLAALPTAGPVDTCPATAVHHPRGDMKASLLRPMGEGKWCMAF